MISEGRSPLSLDGRPLRGALSPPAQFSVSSHTHRPILGFVTHTPPNSRFRQLDQHLHKASDELSRRQASSALGTTLVGLGSPSSPSLFTSNVAVPPLIAIDELIKSNERVLRNLVQNQNAAILQRGPRTPARSQRSPLRMLPAPATPLDTAQRAALASGRARCSAMHVPYRVTPRHQVCVPPSCPRAAPECDRLPLIASECV